MPRSLLYLTTMVLAEGLVQCTGSLSAAIAANVTVVAKPTDDIDIFRFVAGGAEHRRKNAFRPSCVGTFLDPRHAITAAHCLRGDETSLVVECRDADGIQHIETVQMTALLQHPTHDVKLLSFARHGCRAGTAMIAAGIGQPDEFYLPGAVSRPEKDRPQPRLTATMVGPYTIEFFGQDLCLPRGTSGAPLLADRGQNLSPIAGLLISGTAYCPGRQVFVRLDKIREWIDSGTDAAN